MQFKNADNFNCVPLIKTPVLNKIKPHLNEELYLSKKAKNHVFDQSTLNNYSGKVVILNA